MRPKKIAAAILAGVTALALTACGGGSGAAGGGSAPKTTFRLAFNQTAEHPQYKAAVELGKRLSEKTDGRYAIEVYPNEQLGSQSDVIQDVSDGSVDMMYVGGPVMESFNQDFIVFNLPYVFASPEAQAKVFADDAVMGDLKKSVEQTKHITVLTAMHAGVRNVYGTRPVRTPQDLAGMKIRVQQSDSQVKMINQMGGVATPMSQGEVYTALQSGVLDGAENNETVYDALKHDEVAKYYSYTKHLMIPDYLLISTRTLEGMDEKDRQALLGLMPEITQLANEGFKQFVEESKDNAKKLNAEFIDDVQVDTFKERTQDLVKSSINNPVRQKLYDAVQKANG